MKKLLAIIVLGLMFSGNALTKEIYLKKCYAPNSEKKFDSKLYTHYYYKIDTARKIMNGVVGWKPPKEVYITYFKFDYIDDNFARGFMTEVDGQKISSLPVSVNIDKKLIIITNIEIQCE